jgi:hypothetical protein
MTQLRELLMILAVVCLFLATIGVSSPRGNLMAAGLTLWALSIVLT